MFSFFHDNFLKLNLFEFCQEKYTWPEHWTSEVKNVWEQIFRRQFFSMLNQARKDALKKTGDKEDILEAKSHGPIWIAPDVWNILIDI